MNQKSFTSANFNLILIAITLLAIFLRLLVLWQLRETPSFVSPPSGTDMHTYWRLAEAVTEGNFPERFYYQPFYYSVFLPILILLFGSSPWALAIPQAVLAGAAVWLVGWSGKRLFGPRAGLLGALCLTFARMHIFYTPFALMAILQSFWLTAIIALMIWTVQRPTENCKGESRRWGLFGLIFGCANLTRGNIILLLPGLLAVLAWRHWGNWRKLTQYALFFLITMSLVQLPFSLRNLAHTGRWTGPSTAAEAVLALGNNPEAPPGGLFYPPTYETWMEKAGRTGEERISVVRSISRWIAREPLAWTELKVRAALLFWAPMEIPNNVSLDHDGGASSFLHRDFLLDFWLLAGLGLAGTGFALTTPGKRRQAPVLFAAYIILAYWAGTALFYILARFRLPLVPILCVFCGYALHRCIGEIKLWHRYGLTPRAKSQLTRFALVLLLPLLLVLRGFELYQNHLETGMVRLARPHGVLAQDEEKRIIYDHGPEFLGGWRLLEFPPAPLETIIDKQFSISPVQELMDRRPVQLRLPLIFPAAGRVSIDVFHDNQSAGQIEARGSADRRGVQWVEVPLDLKAQPHLQDDSNEKFAESIDLRIKVTAIEGTAPYLVIDEQRHYNRTRVKISEIPSPHFEDDYEAALQLVFQ